MKLILFFSIWRSTNKIVFFNVQKQVFLSAPLLQHLTYVSTFLCRFSLLSFFFFFLDKNMKQDMKTEASAEWAPDGRTRSLTLCSSVFGFTRPDKEQAPCVNSGSSRKWFNSSLLKIAAVLQSVSFLALSCEETGCKALKSPFHLVYYCGIVLPDSPVLVVFWWSSAAVHCEFSKGKKQVQHFFSSSCQTLQ